MAKAKAKAWKHPVADYKYKSGNEGRHHRGLTHSGYWPLGPEVHSSFRPKDDERKAA